MRTLETEEIGKAYDVGHVVRGAEHADRAGRGGGFALF